MRQYLDKITTNILRFILPGFVLLLPLLFLPFGTDYFSLNKRYLLFAFAIITLITWSLRNLARRRIHLSLTSSTLPLLLLTLTYFVSSIFQSPTSYISLIGKTALITSLTIIFIGVTTSQKNPFVIKATFFCLFLSTIVCSLFSLYSYLGLNANLTEEWLRSKSFNPTGNSFTFVTLAIPTLIPLLYLGFKSNRWLYRAITFLSVFIIGAATISQLNIILPQNKDAGLLLPLSAGWSIAVDNFKNIRTALLGTGPETFLYAFTRLKPVFLNQTIAWTNRFTTSSNEYLEVLTTTGLIGFLLTLLALTKPIFDIYSTPNRTKRSIWLNASLLLTIGVIVMNLLLPANVILLSLIFISLSLLNLSLKLETDLVKDININLSATPLQAGNQYEPITVVPKGQIFLPLVVLFISLGLSIWFGYLATRSYAANLATAKAIKTLNSNTTVSYNEQIRAYSLEPLNSAYHMNFSQTSLALANSIASQKDLKDKDRENITQLIQQSIREAKIATQIDPQNVIAWENLASIYRQLLNFAQGASDWTIASYSQAISLDPINPRLRVDLGGVFLSLKDYDQASRAFEQAISLKPDYANAHYNLAVASREKKDYSKAVNEMRIVTQLVNPNSADYQKAQNELKELEKMITAKPNSTSTETSNNNLELVAPTPIPTSKNKIELPQDAAPNLPK